MIKYLQPTTVDEKMKLMEFVYDNTDSFILNTFGYLWESRLWWQTQPIQVYIVNDKIVGLHAFSVNTKGPRWLPLGQMWANVGNVIGQPYDKDIIRSFVTPICVNPGEFVAVTVRFLLGTATASQEVVGNIGFEGYWE